MLFQVHDHLITFVNRNYIITLIIEFSSVNQPEPAKIYWELLAKLSSEFKHLKANFTLVDADFRKIFEQKVKMAKEVLKTLIFGVEITSIQGFA